MASCRESGRCRRNGITDNGLIRQHDLVAGKQEEGALDQTTPALAIGQLVLAEWDGDIKLAGVISLDDEQKVITFAIVVERHGKRGFGYHIANKELKNKNSTVLQIEVGVPSPLSWTVTDFREGVS